MNERSIRQNVAEALEQLQEILSLVDSGELPSEEEFEVMMQHAYQHLNFAWNTRHSPDERVIACEQRDYNRWRKFPEGQYWAPLHRTRASRRTARG